MITYFLNEIYFRTENRIPRLIVRRLDVLGLQSLERGNRDVGDQGEQLVGRVLVVVTPASQTHSDADRNTPTIKFIHGKITFKQECSFDST